VSIKQNQAQRSKKKKQQF